MDLTPPLTRSPSSPSTSYCASETSLDYPSPELVAQQYKLTTIYGTGPPCSVTTSVDPDIALPSLETLGQPDWQQAHAMHHAASSSTAVPSILSSEYDPFGHYDAPIHPPPYAQDMYSHSSQEPSLAGTPPPGSLHPRSPVAQGHRPAGTYAPGALLPSSLPHRMKLDTAAADYSQAVDMSHYPSPRSVHGPYSAEGSYPPSSAGYVSDTHSPSWAQPAEHDPYYAAAAGGQPSGHMMPQNRDMRVAAQSQTRPRRAPRRLTTKEEANFQCEVKGCGKLFSRSYNYKAHMETHDEKREYPFPCLVGSCDKKFVRKTDLQRHNQSVHMKERNFRCDFCARMFARKDTLRRHMDDGCSKRFDIGTLDLRTEGYDGGRAMNASSSSGSMAHLAVPPSSLPPLAVPSLGSSGMLAPMGNRHDPHHGHGWR